MRSFLTKSLQHPQQSLARRPTSLKVDDARTIKAKPLGELRLRKTHVLAKLPDVDFKAHAGNVHNALRFVKAKRTLERVQIAPMNESSDDEARPDQALRLAKARLDRGFSDAKSAATFFGWNYTSYSQHERGQRGLRRDVAERYGRAFRVSPAWLLTGEGPAKVQRVQLIGYAAAGGDNVTFFGDGQGPFDEVDAPEGASPDTVAVQVRGTSLGRLFNGWFAFYDKRQDPPDESLAGSMCVCGLQDGTVLIKTLIPTRTKGVFHLESNTEPTRYDVPVEWAAKVIGMKQP